MASKLEISRTPLIANTADILTYVINNLGCRKSNMCENVTRNARTPQRLEPLESKGLLTMERALGTNVSFLSLTKKWKRFVSVLLEADSLIDYRSNAGTPHSARPDYTTSDLTQNKVCW